jgi:hypothetical protein
MKELVAALAAIVCLSCGVTMKRAALPLAPIPPLVESVVRASEPDGEQEDEYREAAEFYLLKRALPGGDLPIERYIEGKRHAGGMPLYSLAQRRFVDAPKTGAARDATFGAWQSLGPGNVGGRTRSFLFHPADPNTMYAGSVGGGAWKTVDGGASWTPLTDFLPSIGISAMAMDPKNPDVLYAGTGEYYTGAARGDSIRGAGIFKSTDAGATWTRLSGTTGTSFYYVNKIVVSPNDSKRIWVANWTGVWVSFDAGVTWSNNLDRFAPFNGCQDLVIRTDKAEDYLFAACGTGGSSQTAVFRNVNAAGRGSWDSVLANPNMGRTSLALAPSNQSTVYAMAANTGMGDYAGGLLAVYRSTANGDSGSWETRASNTDDNRINRVLLTNPSGAFSDVCSNGRASYTNQGGYDNTIAVDPLNPEVVWVGGIDVFRSDDGGRNWGIAGFWQAAMGSPQLTHSDVHGIHFPPGYNGGDNQTVFVITDGGMYRTDNARADTATGERAACSPYPTKVQWRNVNNGYAVTQFYHGAVYPGGAAYIAGAQDTGTNRGSDASGGEWRRVFAGDGGFVAVDPKDPNILFAETTNLSLVKSTNGGVGFGAATRGVTEPGSNFQFIAPFEMDPSESKRLYIGGRTLWRTVDAAANWAEASSPIPAAGGSISAIGISPSDPDRVVFGTSGGFIYRASNALSSDKNSVWEMSQPRTGFVSHLAFDPARPEIVYATYSQFKTAAEQNHVYKSTDSGATWKGIDGSGSTGLPDIPVFTIVADPQNGSILYLGTDIGVFVSLDGGATWARDDNPFANAVTETLVLDRSAGQTTLVAFTHGRGVWKVALPGSGDACQYDVSGDSASFSAVGETASFKVSAGDTCTWSALPADGVFTVQSPSLGKGAGSFTISAPLNITTQPRAGTIAVQDKAIAVKQDAALAASGNDERASAFDLGAVPSVAVQDTRGATEAASDPVHTCTTLKDSKTVWFKVTAPDAGTLRFSFANRRFDNGADSGTVLTVYPLVGGVLGSELVCSVTPQATNVITTRTPQIAATKGSTYLVEVSATTAGAAVGAALLGGSLSMAATLLK